MITALSTAETMRQSALSVTLHYAGAIAGRGRFDISDPSRNNIAFDPVKVIIRDVRDAGERFDLDRAGFTFVRHPCDERELATLFLANMERAIGVVDANRAYEQALCAYLRDLTGAAAVIPQYGGILARTSNRARHRSWAMPANFVHLDFTANSAAKFLDWSTTLDQQAAFAGRRYAIFQTWRALSPGPQDNSLAICDGSSVPPDDAVVIDSVLGPPDQPGAFFETRLCRHRASHRWYYLSDMTPDDLLIFKGFDSAAPLAMNAMHTAFDNPLASDAAPPRRSIEARFFAVFD